MAQETWLDSWQDFRHDHPTLQAQWLVVPRHPQRVDEVEQLFVQQGFKVTRRSSWASDQGLLTPVDTAMPTIFLGDSLGEMALYYSLSDVALLGGSFEPLGGQNLIEAAACACPIVMGPHTFNFTDASQAAVQAGAAFRVATMREAIERAHSLAQNTEALKVQSEKATWFASQHGGATQRTALAVREWIN